MLDVTLLFPPFLSFCGFFAERRITALKMVDPLMDLLFFLLLFLISLSFLLTPRWALRNELRVAYDELPYVPRGKRINVCAVFSFSPGDFLRVSFRGWWRSFFQRRLRMMAFSLVRHINCFRDLPMEVCGRLWCLAFFS